MKKLKHKKQKNVGLIYEILIKKITNELINGNKDTIAQKILEKYFNKYTEIYKENKIYQIILGSAGKNYNQIYRNLNESLNIWKVIDKNKIIVEKYNLVGEIMSAFGDKFFTCEIRNYKELASIYKLIEAKRISNLKLAPGELLILENNLIESLENNSSKIEKPSESIFAGYLEKLEEERKNLIIGLFSEDFSKFKMNLIEEFYSIREKINSLVEEKHIDDITKVKIKEVLKKNKEIIDEIKESKTFDENVITHLFKLYGLEQKIGEM